MIQFLKLIKRFINQILDIFGFELIKKRALGQNRPSDLDEKELFKPTQMQSPVGLEDYPSNSLIQYFKDQKNNELHKWFHYFEFYDRYFAQFKSKKNIKILEIGVFNGGSLKMWRSYFDPSAQIVGIDINPACEKFNNPSQNIFVRIGPQQDYLFLEKVNNELGPFDIIIDDGSHISEHMISSFYFLYPKALKEGGVYFVEDTHTNYWEIGSGDPEEKTFMGFTKKLINHLNEPHQKIFNIESFNFSNPKKISSMELSSFYATTQSMSFTDSIVVFEKRKPGFLPTQQIR